MIRPAQPSDDRAIRAVVTEAFGQPDEADLVERLRGAGDVLLELVADEAGLVVGHLLFRRLATERTLSAAALAPLAVAADRQGQGIGAGLTRLALDIARERGVDAVIVLGDPVYYGRFGFTAKAATQVASPFTGHPAFMAIELTPGALGQPLTVTYAAAFGL